jgi:hypothetical protein
VSELQTPSFAKARLEQDRDARARAWFYVFDYYAHKNGGPAATCGHNIAPDVMRRSAQSMLTGSPTKQPPAGS